MNIQVIKDAMDALMMQRSSLDQEQGTGNDKIDAAQQELDKLEALLEPNGLAERLYTAYCAAVGGKAYDGKPLPSWQVFRADPTKRVQSDAWVAVARAVSQ
jgi:hypothetical protein